MIGQTISHYKITEKLGGGGMGVVYKAEDTNLKRPVALKFIHPHLTSDEPLKKRFLREARLASSIDHPNICNIYEIDEAPDGRLFFSMAYYDGESLAERAKKAPLPSREVFQICFSIAQGISCAHRNGIIHRDIKPGNIIITEEGFIKIVDFGLAKLSEGSTRITKSDTTVGTVRFMSPEQATEKDVDHRSDIWSLGVILYELATGQYPFRGEIDAAIFYSILHDDPTPANEINPNIPEACAQIISRCLEKDVEKRYQSVDELLEDMGALARELGWGSSIAGLTVPAVGQGYNRKKGHRLRIAGGIVAATVVIGALIAWWVMRESPHYTTDIRLAVMPLVNKTHPDNNACVSGLTEVIYEMFDYSSRKHESMWVVPNRLVRYANLVRHSDAREAFGVNRIVTGVVQRFSNQHLLQLTLQDAASLDQIRSVSIPFDVQSPIALADSLPGAISHLIESDGKETGPGIQFFPANPSGIRPYLNGLGFMLDEKTDNALVSLKSVLMHDANFAAGRNALGWAYWTSYQETDDEALLGLSINELKISSQIAPGYWQPCYNLGEIYRKNNNSDSAAVWYHKVIRNYPGNPPACRKLSFIYLDEKRYDEAEGILQTVIDRHPDYFESHSQLATYYYAADEIDKSIQKLKETIDLAPHDVYSLNMLGILYHQRGEYAQARKLLELAFQLLPNCITCSNIGLILFFEKRYKDSASYYELALEYCGDGDYDDWGSWASSLFWVEGERDQAIELYKKAIDLATQELKTNPEDPFLIGCLIEYYAITGDTARTFQMIAYAESLAIDDVNVLYAIGDAHEIFDNRPAALRYLGEAVRRGFPVAEIEATPELADLVDEPVFQRIISGEDQSDPSMFGPSK
jgi:serine/threonine-protein kinase